MRLDAKNRSWRNKTTAKTARAFDEVGMGDEVEKLIRACRKEGDEPDWIRREVTQFLYVRMCDVYRRMTEDADPLECALISDPELELHVSFHEIAMAYLDACGVSEKPKASKNAGSRSKSRSMAKARATEWRR